MLQSNVSRIAWLWRVRRSLLVVALTILAPVLAVAQSSSRPGASSTSASADTGAQPNYPGIPPSEDKVKTTVGSVKVRLYGTVLFNLSASDAGVFGQELPLWTLPTTGTVTYPDGTVGQSGDNHDLILSMRQTVLGVTVAGSGSTESGWVPSSLVEFDFYGTRPVDTSMPQNRVLTQPRLRLAYLQLEHKSLKVVFGQDRAILAPLDPISLSHVAAPLGATAGDLWAWLPQARIDVSHTIGNTGLLLQAGILRPQFGDPRLETAPAASTSLDVSSSGLGERSTQPFYQARFAVSPRVRGHKATLGIAGHYGKEKIGVDSSLSSWAVAFDADVPISSHIVLRGEAFKGVNLIPFQGGIDQGVALVASATVGAPPQIQNIHASGGWGEVTILPTNSGKNAFYIGAGVDKPNVDDLLPGSGRAKNLFIWGSYFRKLTDSVTLAAEWSNWQFETVTFVRNVPSSVSSPSKANVLAVSMAYQF